MEFLNFFNNTSNNSQINYLTHLMKVAMSDGDISDSELQFIYKIGKKLNVADSEIDKVKDKIHKIKLKEPKDFKSRFLLLFDLVWIMMIDDKLTDNEKKICTNVALKLGYEAEIVNDLVNAIKENLTTSRNKEEAYENILKSIN